MYNGPTFWYLSRTELDEAANAAAAKPEEEEGLVAQAISLMLLMPQWKQNPQPKTGRNEKHKMMRKGESDYKKKRVEIKKDGTKRKCFRRILNSLLQINVPQVVKRCR